MRLRSKITLAMLLLAVVPLVISTGIMARLNYNRLAEEAALYRIAVAEYATLHVSELMRGATNEMGKIAHFVLKENVPEPMLVQQVRDALHGTEFVRVASVYNPEGKRLLTLQTKLYKGPKRPEALSASLMKQARRDKELPALFVDYGGKDEGPFLSLTMPIYKSPGGKPYCYLWTSVSLLFLSEELAKLSARRFGKRPDQVFLLDHKQRLLAHSNHSLWGQPLKKFLPALGIQLRGKNSRLALFIDYSLSGKQFAASIVPIDQLGWSVVVRQIKADTYRAVTNTILAALGVGVFFIILALLLGSWLGGRLAAPVVAVAEAANKVAGGDFETRVTVSSQDEVGMMANAFNAMAGDLQSYRQKLIEETQIRADLGRYLNDDLVDAIVSRESGLELGGERKVITVMFADVVAFTPMTEAHDPEKVVSILNELFTFLTEIIFKHGGIIDKFIGDCVMAVFGAPYGHDDDPLRAARAAEEMMRWLEVGNAKWKKELGVELEMGIGINTGEAVVGNIGSQKRMEYTVIGDTVNVAARLETLARPGQILLTETMVELIEEEFDCASLGTHQLAGRKEPVEIYMLVE